MTFPASAAPYVEGARYKQTGTQLFHDLKRIREPAMTKQKEAREDVSCIGRKKILVLDDEEVVRTCITKLLGHFGFEVVAVKDGAEAVRSYKVAKALGQPYQAVILDLNIPKGMGGNWTNQKLKQIDPKVVTIVSSANYEHPAMACFRQYGFDGILPKPYGLEELSRLLNEVIATSNGNQAERV